MVKIMEVIQMAAGSMDEVIREILQSIDAVAEKPCTNTYCADCDGKCVTIKTGNGEYSLARIPLPVHPRELYHIFILLGIYRRVKLWHRQRKRF